MGTEHRGPLPGAVPHGRPTPLHTLERGSAAPVLPSGCCIVQRRCLRIGSSAPARPSCRLFWACRNVVQGYSSRMCGQRRLRQPGPAFRSILHDRTSVGGGAWERGVSYAWWSGGCTLTTINSPPLASLARRHSGAGFFYPLWLPVYQISFPFIYTDLEASELPCCCIAPGTRTSCLA